VDSGRRTTALALAALQAADLVVTTVSGRYGDAHLQHLGVPRALRPALPAIKFAAVVALLGSASHPARRTAVGLALLPYYTAAATFHVLAGDGPGDVAPAAACAAMAASLI
jgi:hypothetical protein